jgi:hypothetical protein
MLSVARLYSVDLLDECWTEKDLEGNGRSVIDVISRILCRGFEQSHKNLSQYNRCHSRYTNQVLSKCEDRALPLRQPAQRYKFIFVYRTDNIQNVATVSKYHTIKDNYSVELNINGFCNVKSPCMTVRGTYCALPSGSTISGLKYKNWTIYRGHFELEEILWTRLYFCWLFDDAVCTETDIASWHCADL